MQLFLTIAYFIIGLVQLFAIVDGIDYATGLGSILSFIIALVITYIPIIGASAGVYGAVNVWDWPLLQAVVLFFWYVPFLIFIMIASVIAER